MICQNTVGQNSVWDADTIRGQEALIMPNGKKKGILPHGSTTKAGTNTIMNTGLIIVWRDEPSGGNEDAGEICSRDVS